MIEEGCAVISSQQLLFFEVRNHDDTWVGDYCHCLQL